MLHCCIYELCSVVGCLCSHVALMTWIWVVYAHKCISVVTNSDLWLGLVTCFAGLVVMLRRRDGITGCNHDEGPI